MIHSNSKEAFKAITESGRKENRKRDIIEFFLKDRATYFADYQICFGLGFADLNKVKPRLSEMHKEDVLEEGPTVKSHDGSTPVRTSRIKPELISHQTSLF